MLFTLPRMFASSSNCAHVPLNIRADFSLDNGMLLYVMSLARWCSLDWIPEFHLSKKAHTYPSVSPKTNDKDFPHKVEKRQATYPS